MKTGLAVSQMRRPHPVPCILLVNADPFALGRIETLLFNQGYGVVAVSSFDVGSELLRTLAPDLLIADVRLDAFNGLHLAAKSHFNQPGRPVIVTHVLHDPVLERYAHALGAAFVVNPLENPGFPRQVRSAFEEAHLPQRV
jgi:DNA-binding response OmpR family regulator